MHRESQQTQLILDSIPSLVFLKDTSNRILRVNRAVLDTLKLQREDIEGHDSHDVFPDDADRFFQDDLEVIRSGQAKTGYPERAGDRWVRTDKIPLRDASGEIDKLLVIATDVTEVKRAEEAQAKSRRLLETTGRIADVGGWELNLGTGQLDWSEQVCHIHDAPADYRPTVDEAIAFYEPESREIIRGLVQNAVETGEPWDTELKIQTLQDRPVVVRAIGEAEFVDGACVRLWGTLQDITERRQRDEELARLNEELRRRAIEAEDARRQAEAARAELASMVQRLTDSEERYRTLFEKSPVMHANVSANDATIKDCNQMLVERLGYRQKEDLVGKPILSVYDECCHDDVQIAFEEFVEAGEVVNRSLTLKTLSGDPIPVILNVASVRDAEGRILYSSSTWSDVTELTRANRDLREFAYIASHDLKAPLRAINHLASWLDEDLAGTLPKASEAHLTQLKKRVLRMERLLDDLLSYSRASSPDGPTSNVDLGQLIASITELHSSDDRFMVCVDLPTREAQLRKEPLETVLRNLIGNAIKHHDAARARIVIATREADEFVEFTVSDDGPGIPAELRERAFRLFHTLRPRDEVEGSGMGLALAKRLVATVGGTIAIEQAEPRGTRVRFTWPLRTKPSPATGPVTDLTGSERQR